MRQLTWAFVSAWIMSAIFVATAAADSHLPAAEQPVVTTVPAAGVGPLETASPGVILLLLALAALAIFASIRLRARPYSSQ